MRLSKEVIMWPFVNINNKITYSLQYKEMTF